jgi:hypothetical protein
MKRLFACAAVLILGSLGLGRLGGGEAVTFDKLNDADRAAFQQRFEKELWPLLTRAGKDGCVGCHDAKHRSMLRFSGDAGKDFRTLLKGGFFLHEDPGSMLALIESKDKKTRMPPPDRPPWSAADAKVLRQFVSDLDKKQQK